MPFGSQTLCGLRGRVFQSLHGLRRLWDPLRERDVEWKKDRINRWTHYLHDQMGRLVFVVDPAGHTTEYQYCPCGALTGIIDGMGNTTSFFQDIESRNTEKVYADNSTVSY